MRYWALVLLALVFCGTVNAAPTKAELIAQIRAKVAEQAKELEFAERKAREARDNSDRTHVELGRAQEQANQVAKERDGWHAYGDDQHDKWMSAEKRVAQEQASKLKWIIAFSGLSVLVVAYFGLKFLTPLGKIIP
jgi:hypothetical protein